MKIKEISIYPNSKGWAISETHKYMAAILEKLNIKVKFKKFDIKSKYRYLHDRYQLNISRQFLLPVTPWQKYYIDYYHGGIYGEEEFEKNIYSIYKSQKRIKGIRVIAEIYRKILIEKNIDPNLIYKIPLSVDTKTYHPMEQLKKNNLRKEFNIPLQSHLIGSFQKDGSGWGEGLNPKLIKGPDLFVKTIKLLKRDINNLLVILTGPSRGYIKEKLKEINVDYRHFDADDILFRAKLYNLLDGYLITAREEGGPNSFLEAMACGIPVFTTKVGHTVDIGEDGKDSFLVNSFEPKKIAENYLRIFKVQNNQSLIDNIRNKALIYSTGNDLKLWDNFFREE